MSRKKSIPIPEVRHVSVTACLIGLLSILLAAGLKMLGILGRVDLMVASMTAQGKEQDFPKTLPPALVWLVAFGLAVGIAFAILHVPGTWRRVMLWLTALVLVAGWAPVLSLAAHFPAVGAPWIATLWSGVCALVYAGNHRMPCDHVPHAPPSGSK